MGANEPPELKGFRFVTGVDVAFTPLKMSKHGKFRGNGQSSQAEPYQPVTFFRTKRVPYCFKSLRLIDSRLRQHEFNRQWGQVDGTQEQ